MHDVSNADDTFIRHKLGDLDGVIMRADLCPP